MKPPKAYVSEDGMLLKISRDNEVDPPFPNHFVDLEIGRITEIRQEGLTVYVTGEIADAVVENIDSDKNVRATIISK